MIRAVLAVAAAVALLGVASPALADARVDTTEQRLASTAERVDRAAVNLAADTTAVENRSVAARRSVRLRLPSGFAAAPVSFVGIGPPAALREAAGGGETSVGTETPGETESPARGTAAATAGCAFGYRLRGGRARTISLPNVATADGSVVRLDGEADRVRLRYVRIGGGPTVVAERPDV